MAELKPFGWIFTPTMKDITTVEVTHREIVLCRDCKQWDEDGGMMGRGWCGYQMKCTGPNLFLRGRGKRRG